MSDDNYHNLKSQGYLFNDVSPYFPTSESDQQSGCYQSTPVSNSRGITGTGVEEIPKLPLPSGHKGNVRGRKKQKKKTVDVTEPLKVEPIEEVNDKNFNEPSSIVSGISDIDIPGISGELVYQPNPQLEEVPSKDNQTIFNSNTLEQILSYKKMLLFESPAIVEFLQKHRNLAKK